MKHLKTFTEFLIDLRDFKVSDVCTWDKSPVDIYVDIIFPAGKNRAQAFEDWIK